MGKLKEVAPKLIGKPALTDADKRLGHGVGLTFGADPELFFRDKNGLIVGSERVIPEKLDTGGYGTWTQDGIQVELNARAEGCRANVSNYMSQAFRVLDSYLKTNRAGITLSFDQVVRISPSTLKGLSEKSQILGCAPSKNAYDPEATVKVKPGYMKRSGAGHLHLSLIGISDSMSYGTMYKPYRDTFSPERFVKLLDRMVGNTCVLLDRDEGAAERRKVYGRAGEYRRPPHGIEYRTLSNFWLRAYPLWSLICGLSRQVSAIDAASTMGDYLGCVRKWDAAGELLQAVSDKDIVKAINKNDLDLAWKNFEKVATFIEVAFPGTYTQPKGAYLGDGKWGERSISQRHSYALSGGEALDDFRFFARKGLDHWWPPATHDPLTHWLTKGDGHGKGWESFLLGTVHPQRVAAEKEAAKT